MRIALIADWLPAYAGAEHVLGALHELWPHAPVYTTVARRGAIGPLDRADVRTTWLQRLYGLLGRHQFLLPLMPRAIEDIDLSAFDVIVSSSHAVGKGIVPPSHAVHVCYCHTPMRYAWEMEEEYLRDFRVPKFLRKTVRRQLSRLRRWDLATAKRVDVFIANSRETQSRIERVYGRTSTVVTPPVDDRFFEVPLASARGDYFLTVGRLIPYKRIDILLSLARERGIPLKIAGRGSEERRLKAIAGPTAEFLGHVPDGDLPALYANARAFLFPALEDAGVVPIEAQACGTPVVAFGRGGATDTVIDGTTGILVEEQSAGAFSSALDRLDAHVWDRAKIRAHAQSFAQSAFKKKIADIVDEAMEMRRQKAEARKP